MERIAQIIFVLFVLAAPIAQGQAQERVFSEYQYDEVGNIVSRVQDTSGAAPSISEVSPAIVRRNQTLEITLTGVGLGAAQLGGQNSFFSISNVISSNEELSFILSVDQNAEEGTAQISVSTSLGVASFSLNVLTEVPSLRLSPTPLVLSPNVVRPLNLLLSNVDTLDHFVDVSVADVSIATVSTGQVKFDQGSLSANEFLSLSALSNGNTALTFDSETLGTHVFNVRVTDDEFVLTPGNVVSFNAPAVGLTKLFTLPPPDLVAQGPFFSELRVNKQFTQVSDDIVDSAFSNSVGVLNGAYHFASEPNAVGADTSLQNVVISGRGLAGVTSVEINPSDNVEVNDLFADSDGESLNFNLSVAADTPLALRRIILRDANGLIQAASTGASRIYVGGVLPLIQSVSPIFLNRGDLRTITVIGIGLETVRGLRFDNQDNLRVSNIRPADDGKSLTFSLEILGFARIGPRAFTLESLLGDGLAVNANANVLNIDDAPPRVVSPVVSPVVGVARLTSQQPLRSEIVVRANVVGVARGSLVSAITPTSRSRGSSVTIEINGQDLVNVVNAKFEPADGITVNDIIAANDGVSASLSIDIAADAAPSTRRLRLFTDSAALPSVIGGDRFTVTLPQPQINSVSPIVVDRSQTIIPITISGELLNGASSLTVIPNDGITASVPAVSADGRSVEVSLSVSPSAPLLPRVLQLTTPGGVTESSFMPTNTIQVVESIRSIVTPILSPRVGVIREQTPTPPAEQIFNAVSGSVGIVKQIDAPPILQALLGLSNTVGITKGPVIFAIEPSSLPINSSDQTIEVSGFNLDNVTTVQTVPADGVTLSGPAIISNDGTRVTFAASVDDDAPQAIRRLELLTADGSVPYVAQTTSQIRVVGLLPEIESIDPIQQVRGASFSMIIRGFNLSSVQSVQATPSNGIQFATPIAAADGRSLTVPVTISPTVSTEQIVISVITSVGTSILAALPENTFTIISE